MNTKINSYQENLKDLRSNLGEMLPINALDVFDNELIEDYNMDTKILYKK